ncbi:MAG: hypothetical protein JSR28_16505 [Proteobacteria bacterium]|nr:hypothetical protein [Pseudomonadota bacterium]
MDIKVLASGGFPWTTAEHQREKKPLRDNDLQTPLDFSGPPQKDAVERVKKTEHNTQPIDKKTDSFCFPNGITPYYVPPSPPRQARPSAKIL